MKYKLSKIDKLPDPPSVQSLLGNFVHSTLEEFMREQPEDRTLAMAKDWMSRVFADEYAERISPLIQDEEELRKFKWRAWWCIENYFEMEDPTQVVAGGIETSLQYDPKDDSTLITIGGVPIKGFIDRWDDDGRNVHVVDYKTGKAPGRRDWQTKKFQQLLIYADGVSILIGRPAKTMRLMYIKDGIDLVRDVTQTDLKKMRETVKSTYAAVLERCETGEFEATPNGLCKDWCPYRGICPAFAHERTGS